MPRRISLFVMVAALGSLLAPRAAQAECSMGVPDDIRDLVDDLSGAFPHGFSTEVTIPYGNGELTGSLSVAQAGCGMSTVKVSGTVGRAAETSDRAPVRVSYRDGAEASLEWTMPDDAWGRASGPPNPLAPWDSLPPGSTVILHEGFFAGFGAEAQYRALIVAAGIEVAAGNVVAVTRLPDGRVQLSVGPYEAVRSELFVGVGAGPFRLGLASSREVENGTLTSWTFDPNVPDDRRAYQLALAQGTLTGTGSTSRPHDTVVYTNTLGELGLRVEAGPLAVGGIFRSESTQYRVITHADGTTTVEAQRTINDSSYSAVARFDANGNPIGDPEVRITFHNLADSDASGLLIATGKYDPAVHEGEGGDIPDSLTLTLSGDEWKTWQQRAAAYGTPIGGAGSGVVQRIAEAESAQDIAEAFVAASEGNTLAFSDLLAWVMPGREPATPLPGTLSPACDPVDANTEDARALALAQAGGEAAEWCGLNAGRYAGTSSTDGAGDAATADVAIGAGTPRD